MLRCAGERPAPSMAATNSSGRDLLAMSRSCRAGDDLPHQGSTEVVTAGIEKPRPAVETQLHPRGLDVGDQTIESDASHRVDEHYLVPGRTRTALASQIDRGAHVDERQRYKLGESSGASLDLPDHFEMIGPGRRIVDMAKHQCRGRPQAQLVRCNHHLGPLRAADLVRAEVDADIVVKHLGCSAGQAAEARVAADG